MNKHVSGTHGYSSDCWIVKLATISTSVWTGAKSTDWNDTENWDTKTIPAIGTIVIIPAGAPNFPVINSNAICYSLQVDPSATITVNQGYHLEIAGKH